MQKADGGIERTLLEGIALECDTLILTINSEAESALVHIEEDAEYTLPFEALTVLFSL